jgi:hypothetical protein
MFASVTAHVIGSVADDAGVRRNHSGRVPADKYPLLLCLTQISKYAKMAQLGNAVRCLRNHDPLRL